MSCLLDRTKGEMRAVLVFKRDSLQYDIENYCHIEGSVMPRDTDPHNRHMVQDAGDAGNVDRITRVLDLTVTKCKELLYPYTRHKIECEVLDNRFLEEQVYGIVLSVPEDFSQTSLNLLEKLVHELLVCTAVADWLSITNPDKAQTWVAKAKAAEEDITSNLHSRIRRVRRRMHPF